MNYMLAIGLGMIVLGLAAGVIALVAGIRRERKEEKENPPGDDWTTPGGQRLLKSMSQELPIISGRKPAQRFRGVATVYTSRRHAPGPANPRNTDDYEPRRLRKDAN